MSVLIFGFSDPVGAFQGNRAFSGFCLSKPSEASSSPKYDRKALRFIAFDAPASGDHFGMFSVAERSLGDCLGSSERRPGVGDHGGQLLGSVAQQRKLQFRSGFDQLACFWVGKTIS